MYTKYIYLYKLLYRLLELVLLLVFNIIDRDHNSVPAKMLFKLPTYIGFAETNLPL